MLLQHAVPGGAGASGPRHPAHPPSRCRYSLCPVHVHRPAGRADRQASYAALSASTAADDPERASGDRGSAGGTGGRTSNALFAGGGGGGSSGGGAAAAVREEEGPSALLAWTNGYSVVLLRCVVPPGLRRGGGGGGGVGRRSDGSVGGAGGRQAEEGGGARRSPGGFRPPPPLAGVGSGALPAAAAAVASPGEGLAAPVAGQQAGSEASLAVARWGSGGVAAAAAASSAVTLHPGGVAAASQPSLGSAAATPHGGGPVVVEGFSRAGSLALAQQVLSGRTVAGSGNVGQAVAAGGVRGRRSLQVQLPAGAAGGAGDEGGSAGAAAGSGGGGGGAAAHVALAGAAMALAMPRLPEGSALPMLLGRGVLLGPGGAAEGAGELPPHLLAGARRRRVSPTSDQLVSLLTVDTSDDAMAAHALAGALGSALKVEFKTLTSMQPPQTPDGTPTATRGPSTLRLGEAATTAAANRPGQPPPAQLTAPMDVYPLPWAAAARLREGDALVIQGDLLAGLACYAQAHVYGFLPCFLVSPAPPPCMHALIRAWGFEFEAAWKRRTGRA